MRARRDGTEPGAVELIEEAVHLLRRAPATALAIYYAGAVPFVMALLFFWAYTTWFQPSGETVAWGALGLSALFVVMKALQAEFCGQLMALRLGGAAPGWSGRRVARVAFVQLRRQPWALLATAFAALAVFPFGWVYAYGQILTVVGEGDRLHETAATEAKRWPMQNHLGLLLITGAALCMWLNVGMAFVAVPWLANRLLGIDNVFGFSGWWLLNTTFLASITALTWLAIDPLVKSFYTLWVFHGRARRTGDDIRVEFQRSLRIAARVAPAAVMIALALIAAPPMTRGEPVYAQQGVGAGSHNPSAIPPTPRQPEAVQTLPLNRAIDDVLAGSDFAWRLRPLPRSPDEVHDGPLAHFLRQGADILREMLRTMGRWLRVVIDWFDRQFPSRSPGGARSAGVPMLELIKFLLYLFTGLAVLLLVWLVWLVWRQARRNRTSVVSAQPVAAAAPDLRDENIHAAQLPADGWLALAQSEMARGEWRLAWRALYLATLARLANERLISLASFKTNLDYERELRRRALSRTEIVSRFAQRRRGFDAVWYGREVPGEEAVRNWMAELERSASA